MKILSRGGGVLCVTLLKKIERKIKKKTRKLFKLRVLYLPLQVCVRAHSARVRMETRHLRVTRRIFFFFLFFNTTQYYTGVLAAHTHTHTYIDFHGVSLPGRIGKFFRWPPPATRSTTATTIRASARPSSVGGQRPGESSRRPHKTEVFRA